MNKFAILSIVLASVTLSKADCWSTAMGYNCCSGCNVEIEDDSGKWGIENNQWCGIDNNICGKSNDSCWSLPEYPCCNGDTVVYTDGQGDWGYENGDWCGIKKQQPQPIENECWSLPDFPCCNGNTVVYTDIQGDWGYENDNWCGIVKKSDDPSNNDEGNNKNDEPKNEVDNFAPTFSMESGFYENVNGLSLSLKSSGTIYYTLDSSDPTTSNTAKIYNGEIRMYDRSIEENVYGKHQHEDNSPYSTTLQTNYKATNVKYDKLTIVRAATKLQDGSFSPVVTKAYFVMNKQQLQFYSNIPVLSIVTDPSNLYDKDKGIYVCGEQYLNWKRSSNYNPNKSEWDDDNIANFFSRGKEWERPAALTIFKNGKEELSQDVGIRIKGASTRNSHMKSFNIYARKEYGKGKFSYPLIENNVNVVDGTPIEKYDSFSIRSNGWFDRMREAVVSRGVKDIPIVASFDTTKCVLFLDGEFWGTYEIVEKPSDYYFKTNYGIPSENLALLKDGKLEEGTEQDLQEFNSLVDFSKNNDLRNENNYNYIASKIDIESLLHHYAVNLYLGTWDWPNKNYLMYRNKGSPINGNPYSDGKWRYGVFDFDYTTGLTYADFGGVPGYAYDSFKKYETMNHMYPAPIFTSLIKNPKVYNRFSEIMHTMGDEVFNPNKMRKIIEEQKSKYLDYIVKTDWRWFSGTPTMSFETFRNGQNQYFSGGWNDMIEFFNNRPQYIYKFMEQTFGKYKY
ncbi:hypothetical protein H8356DRAFT_1290219 [Neocallimastix lanati (nom. inval.)]|jgi:hypothetical protein|uniref:CBM10 domain-containing protein n=1 Tax=Neocallimastix californiae TaxID=1754190 RepID=A0A1Y2EX26_9FUNG|nr:hypothetical protein H8356DRAFT_1290219 [Neocallimastix sp. JGI-2020a]ORY76139.1 hypothetical protein LY90DRAFT_377479 [Neocallimastix californiae]|eukprot:ORY76139.1 hypothetical protein LY90DRAFT_377479 [Neocallimastix californiae]